MLIFLTLVGAALLALLVVVIYLNDRVNELERRSASAPMGSGWAGAHSSIGSADDNTWRGLTGKGLWDCMCGKQGASHLGAADIEALRLSYEGVLSQHIESLFRTGQADARRRAVNDAAKRWPVALAPCRHPEEMAEAVVRHEGPPSPGLSPEARSARHSCGASVVSSCAVSWTLSTAARPTMW